MLNHRAYMEAVLMAAFWRRNYMEWTRPEERVTSLERAHYWLRTARAIRENGL